MVVWCALACCVGNCPGVGCVGYQVGMRRAVLWHDIFEFFAKAGEVRRGLLREPLSWHGLCAVQGWHARAFSCLSAVLQ
jgi:hypothetical protein